MRLFTGLDLPPAVFHSVEQLLDRFVARRRQQHTETRRDRRCGREIRLRECDCFRVDRLLGSWRETAWEIAPAFSRRVDLYKVHDERF
jgi:hypothetical protein